MVVAGDRLVLELVARSAGANAGFLERRLLAVLAVAALDDEARDNPMKDDVIVVALAGEVDEVGSGLGGLVWNRSTSMSPLSVWIVAEVMVSPRYGVETVSLVIWTGWRAWFSWPPLLGMAAIASTVAMPAVTRPKIA